MLPHEKFEYARLVSLQLPSRKVDPAFDVASGGVIFSVSKKDSSRVREVWHGADVSAAAAAPPPPPHLLAPSSLLGLEASVSSPLRVPKQDGRCLFDQLALPASLVPFVGRPPVCARDLVATGLLDVGSLQRLAPAANHLALHSLLYPRSLVWPMGFSWSSLIAQHTMTAVCCSAGLSRSSQLADDLPKPSGPMAYGLATDDIFVLSRQPIHEVRNIMRRVADGFDTIGVARHEGKDVTGELDGTIVGVDLVAGTHLFANASKIRMLLPALVGSLILPEIRPLDLAVILGHVPWLCLLNRSLFSVLHVSYQFARRQDQLTCQELPHAVRQELTSFIALACYWSFDLSKPWLPDILASDSSPAFGFGVCRLRSTVRTARKLGRLSKKRGEYVVLQEAADVAPSFKSRLGKQHLLPIAQSSFSTVISCRARHMGHLGLLEAHALRLAIEWLGRSPSRFGTRVVVLVDAKATVGAVAKGRASAGTIRRQVSKVASLCLALDISLNLVYVPSEHNTADHPSRGRSLPARRPSAVKSIFFQKRHSG